MKTEKYKRNHYVPKMYMRLFSANNRECVGVYVIHRNKFIPNAPIRGQLCRDYLYGKNPTTEKAFSKIEARVAQIFAEAVQNHKLPIQNSENHEWLILYLGLQHCRTVAAADQHNEGSEKFAKALLRRKAELEGNKEILENLDRVRITRSNAASELVRYATIGASLLADLRFSIIENICDSHFISSDTPVILHNRVYENQHISATGYASSGLQIFLPLGPKLMLLGYDAATYQIETDDIGRVQVNDPMQVQIINDLQWESAHTVLLAHPDASLTNFQERAEYWKSKREPERTVFIEEVIEESGDQLRTRHGTGQKPSKVSLDIEFMRTIVDPPSVLGPYEIPPIRDPERVARVDAAFEALD